MASIARILYVVSSLISRSPERNGNGKPPELSATATEVERLQFLSWASQALTLSSDLTLVAPRLLERAARLLGADLGVLFQLAAGEAGLLDRQIYYSWPEMSDVDVRALLQPVLPDLDPQVRRDCFFHEVVAIEGEDTEFLVVPVQCESDLWGTLCFRRGAQSQEWTGSDVALIRTLSALIDVALQNQQLYRGIETRLLEQETVASDNARLLAAEQEQLQLVQTLQEVGALLTTSLRLEEVYEQIFDLLARVVSYDSVSILLLQDDGHLELAAARGLPDYRIAEEIVQGLAYERLVGPLEGVRYRVITDTQEDEAWVTAQSMDYIRSWVGALLVVKGKPIGVLNVDKSIPGAYSDAAGKAVAAFANQAAVAIENARLHEETRQRANELEIVHQVSSAIATVVDIDQLIEQTTEFIASRIYPDVFGFVLLEPSTGLFMPHYSYHGLPPGGSEIAVPLHESVTGWVVRTGQALLVPDVGQEPLYFSIVSETRSEIAVPLHCNGQVIGAINVESREPNAFSETDMRFLKTLAGQVATAIERAQLYENLEEQAADLAEEVRDRTAELQSERDRMLAILESAGEGILFIDCDETILYINPAMERQTGYSREECLGKTPHIWRCEQTPESVFDEMWETIVNGQRWQGEMISRRKDGSTFDASVTVTPLYDSSGGLTGYVRVQADISRLKEVDRLKSKFIANVSHELRTPLTNIRMYVSLLERGKMARWEHYLAVIQQETDRLTRLIQDLLDLSRLEARAPLPKKVPVDMASLVEEVVQLFQARAERKRITIRRQVESGLPPVLVEKSELQQVFNNLVANALAYTPSDGTVKIRAEVDEVDGDEGIRLQVSDNGPGIRDEERPRLFERFYRGSAALRGKEPGTGLGLSICKEIIDYYGGTIRADVSDEGGALFTVWWPIGAK